MRLQKVSDERTFDQAIGVPSKVYDDRLAFISYAHDGIEGQIIRNAINTLDNRDVMVKVLGTDATNISRIFRRKHITQSLSEQVLDTLRVYREALRIFGNMDQVTAWMHTPVAALKGNKPDMLLDTFEGRQWVKEVLSHIEFGEFS